MRRRSMLALAFASAACSDGAYDVVIRAASPEVLVWELFVVPGDCLESFAHAAAPEASIKTRRWMRGQSPAPLGVLDPAQYAFYVRASDDQCAMRWAACTTRTLEEDGRGLVELALEAADGPRCIDEDRCNGVETCDAGVCVPGTPIACDDPLPPSPPPPPPPVPPPPPPPPECTVNAQCDDEVFCNGEERCGDEGMCVSDTGDPCAGRYACPDTACDADRDRCVDFDGDDWACGEDCDDDDDEIHPDALEVCNDLDDNCNDEIDEGDVCN